MAEINVNVDELQNCIQELVTLQSDCDSVKLSGYNNSGSGKTSDVLEGLRSECALANDLLIELIQNTMAFLVSVKNSVSEADSKAAKKLAK